MKMPIFFLMILVVGINLNMIYAQEISHFKLGREECSTKCKSGYLKVFDSCTFNFDISFKETLPDLSSLNFELLEASSNIYTHLLTLDMKSDCEGYKENADVYCTELNMNVFSITIKANELSRYSEAKIRAYITTPNKPNVFSDVQEFPKFYDIIDASGELKINGIQMAPGLNCNTTTAGKDLTIEFHCISEAKPCMIQLKVNENVEFQEEENDVLYQHIFTSSHAVNVTIQFSACRLENFYNNISCTIKTDIIFSNDSNNHTIIAVVASTISIIVAIAVIVILLICWRRHIQKGKLEQNKDTHAMELLIKTKKEEDTRIQENSSQRRVVNKREANGWTALMLASAHGHVEIVKQLIEKEANIDEQNEHGWTSLMVATSCGHVEIVRNLIEHKANINRVDKDGWDALKIAAAIGHTALVAVLTEQNPLSKKKIKSKKPFKKMSTNLDNKFSIIEESALVEMIENTGPSHEDEIPSIINEEQLDVQNEPEFTAKVILENNASKDNLKEQIERTNKAKKGNLNDFIRAVRRGHTAAVNFLINNGENVNDQTEDGMTALMIASFKGYTKVAYILLSNDAEVNARDKKGLTALMFASYMGHKDTVELLMSKGANIEQGDKEEWSALMHASQNGKIETVNVLLEHSLSIDSDKYNDSDISNPTENNEAISTKKIIECRNIDENNDSIVELHEPTKDVIAHDV